MKRLLAASPTRSTDRWQATVPICDMPSSAVGANVLRAKRSSLSDSRYRLAYSYVNTDSNGRAGGGPLFQTLKAQIAKWGATATPCDDILRSLQSKQQQTASNVRFRKHTTDNRPRRFRSWRLAGGAIPGRRSPH
jgi:hypothetical protein